MIEPRAALALGVALSAAQPPAAGAYGSGDAAVLELGEHVYRRVCYICHEKGVRISESLGAPRLGDPVAWETRALKGVDALFEVVANPPPGAFRMPVGALSEAEIRSAIIYMLKKSEPQ